MCIAGHLCKQFLFVHHSNNICVYSGAGYHMVMTKADGCDVDKIGDLLTRHVPEAKLESMS